MKFKISEIETSVKRKLNHIFSALNHRRKESVLEFEVECIEEEEGQDVSTLFLQTQKNQIIDLQDRLEIFATFFQSLASTAQNTTLI